jgi:hypothetical protein
LTPTKIDDLPYEFKAELQHVEFVSAVRLGLGTVSARTHQHGPATAILLDADSQVVAVVTKVPGGGKKVVVVPFSNIVAMIPRQKAAKVEPEPEPVRPPVDDTAEKELAAMKTRAIIPPPTAEVETKSAHVPPPTKTKAKK